MEVNYNGKMFYNSGPWSLLKKKEYLRNEHFQSKLSFFWSITKSFFPDILDGAGSFGQLAIWSTCHFTNYFQADFLHSFITEGTIQKVYILIHKFCNIKWNKLLKPSFLQKLNVLANFTVIKSLPLLLFLSIFFYAIFILFTFSELPSVGF
jgi:hypothetical protein